MPFSDAPGLKATGSVRTAGMCSARLLAMCWKEIMFSSSQAPTSSAVAGDVRTRLASRSPRKRDICEGCSVAVCSAAVLQCCEVLQCCGGLE